MKIEIIPAILVKTRKRLIKELKDVHKDVKTVQIDIMDGKFVRNTTIMASDFKGVKKKIKYEIQLMVKNPADHIVNFKKIKSNTIIFHIESQKNKTEVLDLIKKIKKYKMKVGIGLNPKTKVERIKLFFKKIDLVLIMTVNPGAGGRRFIPSMLKKVRKIRRWNKKIDIEVDGGINQDNIHQCVEAGANKLVIGSAIFKKNNIHKAIKSIKSKI